MRKIIFFFIAISISMCVSIGVTFAENTDYVEVYGDFIANDLKKMLKEEYKTCDIEFFKDCYMVDLDNNQKPELLCIFCEESDEYAVLIEYDGEFKIGKEIPFDYNNGSAGSVYYRILKADKKFYFEKYVSSRQDWESPDGMNGWVTENKITLNENGEECVVYHATHNKGVNYVNDNIVEEIDYEYVHNNFEIVADGHNYGELWNGYEPQFGADYAKFWDNSEISVLLNGEKVVFDQQPIIMNDRTLIPVRAIIEKMGGTVNWIEEKQTAVLELNTNKIELIIDSRIALVNGESRELDVAPRIIGNRTLLPIRFIAENLGFDVEWSGESCTIIITN